MGTVRAVERLRWVGGVDGKGKGSFCGSRETWITEEVVVDGDGIKCRCCHKSDQLIRLDGGYWSLYCRRCDLVLAVSDGAVVRMGDGRIARCHRETVVVR